MRVNNQTYNSTVQNPDSVRPKRTEEAPKTGTEQKVDKTSAAEAPENPDVSTDISARAKEMAQAKSVATAAPDLREAKIAELKKRIAAKQYNVKPEDVAEKMVREHLQTRGSGSA